MLSISTSAFFLCLLALPATIRAQVSISSVANSGCVANAFGTATYSTQLALPTGSQRVVAGSFWQQAGANWTFSTDTKGVIFSDLGIPGLGTQPYIPQADHDALNLDGSKTKWSLSIPTTPPSSQDFDIVFNVAGSSAAAASTQSGIKMQNPFNHSTTVVSTNGIPSGGQTGSASASSASGTRSIGRRNKPLLASPTQGQSGSVVTKTAVTEVKLERRTLPPGVKYRRAIGSTTFKLTIEGTWGCLLNPSGTVAKASVTSNAAVASLCSNNEISAVTQSWSTYGVCTLIYNLP